MADASVINHRGTAVRAPAPGTSPVLPAKADCEHTVATVADLNRYKEDLEAAF